MTYQEKFMNLYKQMNKDIQMLFWYNKIIAKQERSSKALEYALWFSSYKLRKIEEENKIIRYKFPSFVQFFTYSWTGMYICKNQYLFFKHFLHILGQNCKFFKKTTYFSSFYCITITILKNLY